MQRTQSRRALFALFAGFLLVVNLAVQAQVPATGTIKNARAVEARSEYDQSVRRAHADFETKVPAARKKYSDVLTSVVRISTKGSDLAEANLLNAALADLDGPLPFEMPLSAIKGLWKLRGTDGYERLYQFDGKGNVLGLFANTSTRPLQGTVQRADGEMLLVFKSSPGVRRLSVTRNRMFVEHWEKNADYPAAPPNYVSVGIRQIQPAEGSP